MRAPAASGFGPAEGVEREEGMGAAGAVSRRLREGVGAGAEEEGRGGRVMRMAEPLSGWEQQSRACRSASSSCTCEQGKGNA